MVTYVVGRRARDKMVHPERMVVYHEFASFIALSPRRNVLAPYCDCSRWIVFWLLVGAQLSSHSSQLSRI